MRCTRIACEYSCTNVINRLSAKSNVSDSRELLPQILSAYRNEINERFAISFSDIKIAENFRVDELPIKLIQLLSDLEAFTRSF